jgi:hypothetical protein
MQRMREGFVDECVQSERKTTWIVRRLTWRKGGSVLYVTLMSSASATSRVSTNEFLVILIHCDIHCNLKQRWPNSQQVCQKREASSAATKSMHVSYVYLGPSAPRLLGFLESQRVGERAWIFRVPFDSAAKLGENPSMLSLLS